MIAVIIQARMSSTRLPGKTLANIAGEPMLGHVLRRAKNIPGIDRAIIATTENPADIAIYNFARENDIPVYIGSENDVLDRFYQASKYFGVSVIIRVTPDCPILDPEISGLVLNNFLKANGSLDYVSNVHPPTFPDGLDTEVFSFTALEQAWCQARKPSEREHVTPYIWKHPEQFCLANVSHSCDLSSLRWTVDEAQDLEFVRAVYNRFSTTQKYFGMTELLESIEKEPHLLKINQGISRNEGYYFSLNKDEKTEDKTSNQ
ncbi:cytidylyltransferase domain-containing protein [Lusitaniella coriacea]|uniref:cytidylyltransferase domain-containing protein n=1 Tax=Lusitaniella coriacea TaxID=1983105 RepID=UPI003CFB279D